MVNDVEYAAGEKGSCPSGKCVRAWIKVQSGTLTDSDCYDRFIQEPSYLQAAEVSLHCKPSIFHWRQIFASEIRCQFVFADI